PERVEPPPLEQLEHGRLDGGPVRGDRQRRREVGDPEDRPHSLADLVEVGARVEIEDQTAGQAADAAHAAAGRGLEEVPAEPAEEERPVPALQADLVIMDDDARGRRPPAHGTTSPEGPRDAWDAGGRPSAGSPPSEAFAASASGAAPVGRRASLAWTSS